jgi:hypothetical protein
VNEQELRRLVREAVARHLQAAGPGAPPLSGAAPPFQQPSSARPSVGSAEGHRAHPSHHLYLTVVNVGEACVIEPQVACDHCGYCRSHGH